MKLRFLFAFTILCAWIVTGYSPRVYGHEDEAICKHETIAATEPIELVPHPAPLPPWEKAEQAEVPLDKRSWTKFKYNNIIRDISNQYDLDPQLIYATIMTESQGREYVYRYEPHLGEGSYCMGQILLSTARRLGFGGNPNQIYQPKVCIDLIARYHRLMLDTHGELTPVQLARAYNTGSPYKSPRYGHIKRFNEWMNETT